MDGILAINKPRGMTSHDVVFQLRKILKTKKIGHTGTLDPDVDGVLVVCIGLATKLVQFMESDHKVYRAEALLGRATTTEDISGETTETAKIEPDAVSETQVIAAINQFSGMIQQIPPMYSAIKINGKKLYEYAREGKVIDRPARSIEVYHIDYIADSMICENDECLFRFTVESAKGLYVRTLCVDIGRKLGFPATMSDLTRVASGDFRLEDCFSLEQVQAGDYKLVRMADINLAMPKVAAPTNIAEQIRTGTVFHASQLDEAPDCDFAFVDAHSGDLLAVYQPHPSKPGLFKPVRVFCT